MVGRSYFEGISTLKEVTLPCTLIKIQNDAFRNCMKLHSVVTNKNLTDICAEAFSACTSSERIHVPSTVRYMGSGALWNCTALKEAILSAELIFSGKL